MHEAILSSSDHAQTVVQEYWQYSVEVGVVHSISSYQLASMHTCLLKCLCIMNFITI